MTNADLDAAYTHLCQTLTLQGEAQTQAFLARLAILALARSPSGEAAMALIEAAAVPNATPAAQA